MHREKARFGFDFALQLTAEMVESPSDVCKKGSLFTLYCIAVATVAPQMRHKHFSFIVVKKITLPITEKKENFLSLFGHVFHASNCLSSAKDHGVSCAGY